MKDFKYKVNMIAGGATCICKAMGRKDIKTTIKLIGSVITYYLNFIYLFRELVCRNCLFFKSSNIYF